LTPRPMRETTVVSKHDNALLSKSAYLTKYRKVMENLCVALKRHQKG
jgi:hypothetical protein